VPQIADAGGFTITSTPRNALSGNPGSEPPFLELAIQRSPKNPPAAWLWQPPERIIGKKLEVRVGGKFVWPPPGIEERSIRRAVFVAGGVGINPLKSMISHLHETSTMPPEVKFLYTVRWPSETKSLDQILFYKDLRTIAESDSRHFVLQLFITDGSKDLGKENENSNPRFRRITHEDLRTAVVEGGHPESTVCYICGVPSMTDDFVDFLQKTKGLDQQRVLCEKWW